MKEERKKQWNKNKEEWEKKEIELTHLKCFWHKEEKER